MEVLHRTQGAVEIIHRTVHLVAGAWGSFKVVGSLKEVGFGLQMLQPRRNRGLEVLARGPFQQASESLGKFSFAVAPVDMPKLLPEDLPLLRGRATEVSDFNHFMQKAQYPHDTWETILPSLPGCIPAIKGHRLWFILWEVMGDFMLKHPISCIQLLISRTCTQRTP